LRKLAGVPRQNNESCLKSVFGVFQVAENPPAHGKDKRPVAMGEGGKRGLVTGD
jgi:hypothetical protein